MPKSLTAVGDIVSYEDRTWVITSHDRGVRTVKLQDWAGETTEVPDTPGATFRVLARPSVQWPFVAAPIVRDGGPVVCVTRAGRELEPLIEWAPSSRLRPGGSIFFNPSLRLRRGEVLVAHHEKGVLSRINITPAFGTVGARRKRVERQPPPPPPTAAERIMRDDGIFEDYDEDDE